jgi:hypothetical protein
MKLVSGLRVRAGALVFALLLTGGLAIASNAAGQVPVPSFGGTKTCEPGVPPRCCAPGDCSPGSDPVQDEIPADLTQYPTAIPAPPGALEADANGLEADDVPGWEPDNGGGIGFDTATARAVQRGEMTLAQAAASADAFSCEGGPFKKVVRRTSPQGWKVKFGGLTICTEALSQSGQAQLQSPAGTLQATGNGYAVSGVFAISNGSLLERARNSHRVFYTRNISAPSGEVWGFTHGSCRGAFTTLMTCDGYSRVFR